MTRNETTGNDPLYRAGAHLGPPFEPVVRLPKCEYNQTGELPRVPEEIATRGNATPTPVPLLSGRTGQTRVTVTVHGPH